MEKVPKERREKILEKINPDNYEISWNEEGVPYKFKSKIKKKRGKLSRGQGARFELQVRKDLESKGRVVDKWGNNVDIEENKLVQAKRKYNPFKKMLVVGTGFPDFISIKKIHEGVYSVIGVEVKMNGIISKIEKQKCAWYLKKGIFSEIWIAKKGAPKGVHQGGARTSTRPRKNSKKFSTGGNKRGQIEYDDFKEKYGGKFGL